MFSIVVSLFRKGLIIYIESGVGNYILFWVGWGCLCCITCRICPTFGTIETSYTTSLGPPGPPCSKQENQPFVAPLIPHNKANHLQRDGNCFLPQGGKTVKLDRYHIGVSDVISCNTSVLIVSGNPARSLK